MTQPTTYHSRAGLLALLLASAVDRLAERLDAWWRDGWGMVCRPIAPEIENKNGQSSC